MTCPAGYVPDPVTATCINDLCSNISGDQDTQYIVTNNLVRDRNSECHSKLIVSCSVNPTTALIGESVTWTASASG